MAQKKEDTVIVSIKKESYVSKIPVYDRGIGIGNEDTRKQIIDFQQLGSRFTRRSGSAGFGLSITKKLLEMNGGKIIVKSKSGDARTFTFLLPIFVNNGEKK